MTQRIGFCCKWVPPAADNTIITEQATTVAWLNRQNVNDAENKLWNLMVNNIQHMASMIEKVGALPANQRMCRISSNILPVFTESRWSYFWKRSDVIAYCERELAVVGQRARELDVRLSFHPGQFVCLASDNADIVLRSVEEFEYHAQMARWMGYGRSWHDHGFKINVHLSGRNGVEGFQYALTLLSTEARNLITVENDEMSHGLEDVLQLADDCAVVLDCHHHWVRTGEYIQPTDARVQQVIDSWRGVRPVMHYSVSREDLLVGHDPNCLPDMTQLIQQGLNKQRLRAHSDYYWNSATNQWAQSFWPCFDIQCESKMKNLASSQLALSFSCGASL
jgi:UV DNA damage repair endonuclease